MQEFEKSETQCTNVNSNKSNESLGEEYVTDTAKQEKEAEFCDPLNEQQSTALQPNVLKYDCSPKDKPFHFITVQPTSPNLTITVINHEEEEEEHGLQMGKKGTHEVNSVLHGPNIDRCTEREFFKLQLERMPQMGEIW